MACYVRSMQQGDVDQVTVIDREAFPTQWPAANYQHELRNRLAHYIVVCDDETTVEPPQANLLPGKDTFGTTSRLRRFFSRRPLKDELSLSCNHYVVGFCGFWVMADEAHIISIAVRETYRRRGIGELLLMSVVSLARELQAGVVTLEVRASNTGAQALYTKYGFTQVGVRRGYYTDNNEDGFVMTTPDITSAPFQIRLQRLKQAHARKGGNSFKLSDESPAQPGD